MVDAARGSEQPEARKRIQELFRYVVAFAWNKPAILSDVLIHAVGMVCGLGAATLATMVTRRRDTAALIAGFVVAVAWLRPEPVWVGALVVVVAGLGLGTPRFNLLGAVVAGTLAGVWFHVLRGYGLPGWSALPLAAAVPVAAMRLAHRNPGFAPLRLREDALLTMCTLGVLVAATPAFSTGWMSAVALNIEPGNSVEPVIGTWVPVGLAAVVSLGGVHTLWRRR